VNRPAARFILRFGSAESKGSGALQCAIVGAATGATSAAKFFGTRQKR
jgi:hypothetical protein